MRNSRTIPALLLGVFMVLLFLCSCSRKTNMSRNSYSQDRDSAWNQVNTSKETEKETGTIVTSYGDTLIDGFTVPANEQEYEDTTESKGITLISKVTKDSTGKTRVKNKVISKPTSVTETKTKETSKETGNTNTGQVTTETDSKSKEKETDSSVPIWKICFWIGFLGALVYLIIRLWKKYLT